MDDTMEEMLNCPLEEQLAYLRRELAEMRDELALIREAMGPAIREWMVQNAEEGDSSPN